MPDENYEDDKGLFLWGSEGLENLGKWNKDMFGCSVNQTFECTNPTTLKK